MDRNFYHAEHDALDLSDMRYLARVPGDVIKPGAHGHMLCSALQFDLWYKALALKKEERAGTRNDHGDADSREQGQWEYRASTGIWDVNSALHYVLAVENNQLTTARRRAAYSSVVEMANHFWHLGASWGELLGHAHYGYYGKAAKRYSRWTNMMSTFLGVSAEKQLFSGSTNGLRT